MRTPAKGLLALLCGVVATLVAAAPALAETFSNTSAVTVPATGTFGPASPYPSSVEVSGMTGPVTDVNVTLNRIGHEAMGDVSLLLVSPGGQGVRLMRGNCFGSAAEDSFWTFDQQAADGMPQTGECGGVVYRPNPVSTFDPWPSPAPAGPYGSSLDDFNGENPNGTWSLYVHDTYSEDVGDIEGGWILTVGSGSTDMTIPATGTSGQASRFPAIQTVPPTDEVVTDVDVTLEGVWHQRPDDLELLLVGPGGQAAVLMSDACGTFEAEGVTWTWDDEASPMSNGDASNTCPSGSYRPTDHEGSEAWAPPAPAGPHEASLAAFDLTDPSGEWSLYAADDSNGAVGFVVERFQLDLTTQPQEQPPPPPEFGTDTLVKLGLAKKRVRAAAPVRVRVTNGNAFAVTGLLKQETFEVAGDGQTVVKISLSKRASAKLSRKGSARIRVAAQVTDPAGNTRLVKRRLRLRLKRSA